MHNDIWMLQTKSSHLWKVRYAIILLGLRYSKRCNKEVYKIQYNFMCCIVGNHYFGLLPSNYSHVFTVEVVKYVSTVMGPNYSHGHGSFILKLNQRSRSFVDRGLVSNSYNLSDFILLPIQCLFLIHYCIVWMVWGFWTGELADFVQQHAHSNVV